MNWRQKYQARRRSWINVVVAGLLTACFFVPNALGQPVGPVTQGQAATLGNTTIVQDMCVSRDGVSVFGCVKSSVDSNFVYLSERGWRVLSNTAGSGLYMDTGDVVLGVESLKIRWPDTSIDESGSNLRLVTGIVELPNGDPQIYASNANSTVAFSTNCSAANCANATTTAAFTFFPQNALDATDWVFNVGNGNNVSSLFNIQYNGSINVPASAHTFSLTNGTLSLGAEVFDMDGNSVIRNRGTTQTVPTDGAGTAAAFTISVYNFNRYINCQDPNGCNATMSETSTADGYRLCITNISANAVNFTDTAGVTELTGAIALGQWDNLCLIYVTDRWVQLSTSNN